MRYTASPLPGDVYYRNKQHYLGDAMRLARLTFLALALALAVTATGCVDQGVVVDSSTGAPAVSEYSSEHYIVRLVGARADARGGELARHAALMMEKMFDVYAGMEEVPLPAGQPMPFWLHLNRKEYDRQAALYDFPAHATNGFCTTSGEVHVYYKKSGKLPPEATAMHEGFHQYSHRALHYPTPAAVFQRVPGYKVTKIPTVPLWLAEGLATNMESGRIERDHNGIVIAVDDVGSVNQDRLANLVQLINSGRCPSVRTVMNLIMGDQISSDDYAVRWGIVFDLRMATGNAIYVREQREIERAGPGAVQAAIDAAIDPNRPYPYLRWPVPVVGRFLRACRVVWGLDVPELIEICSQNAREPRDFDRQWNRRLTQAALSEVEKLLRDQGQSLEQWEDGWKKRMLALHAEVRGGTYRYVEPASLKSICRERRSPGSW